MDKRCFICGAKEDNNGNCTNSDCPRYPKDTPPTTESENQSAAK